MPQTLPDCYGDFFDRWNSECAEAPNCWYCEDCEKLSIEKTTIDTKQLRTVRQNKT